MQAAGHVPVDFAASGADLMSVTAHKLGGPIGVGALVVRRDAALVPLTHGGGQERQVRSGTLDTPAIVGFAAALVEATASMEAEAARLWRCATTSSSGPWRSAPTSGRPGCGSAATA